MTHTLIPNPNPNIRVLLHRDEREHAYVTVERLEHDAIGTPQWLLIDDGRSEKIAAVAFVALIAHVQPAALAASSPTVIGVGADDGHRYRCSVARGGDGIVALTIEQEDIDMAGAPRWNAYTTEALTDGNGVPRDRRLDPDIFVKCIAR